MQLFEIVTLSPTKQSEAWCLAALLHAYSQALHIFKHLVSTLQHLPQGFMHAAAMLNAAAAVPPGKWSSCLRAGKLTWKRAVAMMGSFRVPVNSCQASTMVSGGPRATDTQCPSVSSCKWNLHLQLRDSLRQPNQTCSKRPRKTEVQSSVQ